MNKVQSTCNYCALSCNLDFYEEDGRIVKVVPTKDYPVNQGFSCIKGLCLDRQTTVKKQQTKPRIRQKDGSFQTVSWEDGYQYVADELKRISDTYGGDSIAGISTGQLTMEEMALFGHVMRNYLKAHVDGNTRLCMATSVVAHKQSFGFDAPPYTLNDFELSDTIFLIGANPIVAHPIIWDRIRKNQNKKVIVIDPRNTETAKQSDIWYGLNPKSDLILFYTIANLLIEKGYVDQAYIASHTEGYEEFKQFVQPFSLERAVEETGLSREQLLEMVELIHTGKRVSFWWTMGINQGYQAVRTAQAIINLALMTGNIGREGTGANSITGQCNAMGSRVFSNTSGLFGGGDFDNENRRKAVREVLQIEDEVLAAKPTLPYNVIIEKINSGEIKALWVLCTNPRHSWINNETFLSAMEKLELFVVQDVYDDTDTSRDCDVFFPVVPGLKKEGTYINTERRLSAMRVVIPRTQDERSDYEVIYGVGKALGMGDLLNLWKTPKDAFELMKQCSKGMPVDITGVSYDALTNSKGIQWPFREGEELKDHQRRLYEDGNYYTPSKKAKFVFEEVMDNPLPCTKDFPYILNTGRGTVGQWHTQTRTREISFVEDAMQKQAYILMNETLGEKLNITSNDLVEVSSINGKRAIFTVLFSDEVQGNHLFAPLHYIETNRLTPSVYDTYSKEPSYKCTPVSIQKLGDCQKGQEGFYETN